MSEPTNGADQDTTTRGDPQLRQAGLRVRGHSFVLAFHKTMRTIMLYPIENAQVTESLDELASATADILTVDGGLEMRLSSELFYVNDIRLRLELEHLASFGQVLRICSHAGIGVLRVDERPGPREWKAFITELLRFEPETEGELRADEFQSLILSLGVRNVTVGPPSEGDTEFGDELTRKLAAKRIYRQSVAVTKQLFESARMGRAPGLRQITRAVQSIVDQVLNNEVTIFRRLSRWPTRMIVAPRPVVIRAPSRRTSFFESCGKIRATDAIPSS